MENYSKIFSEIVKLIKNYGIDAVYWLFVAGYIAALVFPEFTHDIFVSNNVIVFGIIYMVVKFFNKKNQGENFQDISKIRSHASTNVRADLSKLLGETKADRAYVFEFHNGKQNATNMAFTYFDMTHEVCLKGIEYMSDDFQNVSTTLCPMSDYLINHYHFMGTIEELEEIDPRLAHRMSNKDKYCCMSLLRSNGIDIGIIGISYEASKPSNTEDVLSSLSLYAQDISSYLDLRRYEKNE